MTSQETMTVCDKEIKYDASNGQGHCWRDADDTTCPASIAEEIAAEIIDGKQDACDDYVASNGCHYRWS